MKISEIKSEKKEVKSNVEIPDKEEKPNEEVKLNDKKEGIKETIIIEESELTFDKPETKEKKEYPIMKYKAQILKERK